MYNHNLSAVIITKNEERNIGRCLQSLQGVVDEIIVVDSMSSDHTEEICSQYTNLQFVKHEWEGYSKQKNLANSLASNNYILSIDADEALSPELQQSILSEKEKGFSGSYRVKRLTNYCGNWIHHCGWYPDAKIRVFNRNEAQWEGNIHETLRFVNPILPKTLKGDLYHYTIYTTEEHLRQIDLFTDIRAKDLKNKEKKASFFNLHIKPAIKFFKIYVLHLGFLDGKSGFQIAKFSAYSVQLRYRKINTIQA